MKDLVLERTEKEICPICAKNMNNIRIKVVKYKDKEILICDKHYVQKREEK